jgi:hypothetical protein
MLLKEMGRLSVDFRLFHCRRACDRLSHESASPRRNDGAEPGRLTVLYPQYLNEKET